MIQMSQTMRLEQRLSPQQILLSTLLQLPLLSLEQKIQTELELNPVMEEVNMSGIVLTAGVKFNITKKERKE